MPRGRNAAGYVIDVPEGLVVERPPSDCGRLRLIERRPGGRVEGELDICLFWPSLIVDRDGVLRGTAVDAAAALLAAPRDGYSSLPMELELSAGPGWRVDLVVETEARDERGERGKPSLPYQTTLAVGHPDFRKAAAIFITVRAASESWAPGASVLESLRFAGRQVAAARPRLDGLVFTS